MKKYKVIIAGSRTIHNRNLVSRAIIASGWKDEIGEVVCGDAYGVDKLGEEWANLHNIVVKHFPAKWDDLSHKDAIIKTNARGKYDSKAGMRRNEAMGKYADKLIAIIQDNSRGTSHMIEYMQKLEKPIYIWEV